LLVCCHGAGGRFEKPAVTSVTLTEGVSVNVQNGGHL
jgi:hypothetical protein